MGITIESTGTLREEGVIERRGRRQPLFSLHLTDRAVTKINSGKKGSRPSLPGDPQPRRRVTVSKSSVDQ